MNNRIAKKLFWMYLVSFIACAFLYSVSFSQAATAIDANGAPSGFDQPLQPATMDWEQASQLCAGRGGALPTVEELQAIADETGNGMYAAYAWPKGMFWTSMAGTEGHKAVFMGNGKEQDFPDSFKQWVTCRQAERK